MNRTNATSQKRAVNLKVKNFSILIVLRFFLSLLSEILVICATMDYNLCRVYYLFNLLSHAREIGYCLCTLYNVCLLFQMLHSINYVTSKDCTEFI